MKSLVILATGIGLGGSAAATYRAHRKPMSPEWDERVGDTRFRRSDLPIGGAAAMTLAFGSLVTGHRKAAAVLAGAGLGATAGSLGVAVLDPLADPEPAFDDAAPQPPRQPPTPPASDSVIDLSGAASTTLADADDALGGVSTSTADGVAAEARAEASRQPAEPESGQTPDSGEVDEEQAAPTSDAAQPSSVASDAADDAEAEAEHQLEQAEEAVEHQASYGSPSLDDLPPDAADEPALEVTGSAPQQDQLSAPDALPEDDS